MLMRKAFVHAVADGAVVVEAGKDLLGLVQDLLDALDVEEGFLLTCERGIRQVLCGCGRSHGVRTAGVVGLESRKRLTDGRLEFGREGLRLDHSPDFRSGGREGADVLGIEGREPGIDALSQSAVRQNCRKA